MPSFLWSFASCYYIIIICNCVQVYCDISDVVFSSWPNAIDAVRIPSEAAFLSFASAHLGALRSTSGCMLVLLSLALSRGVEGLQADMDDPTNGRKLS